MQTSPFKELAKAADQYADEIKKNISIKKSKTKKKPKKKTNIEMEISSEIDPILENIFTLQSIRHYLTKDVPDSYIVRLLDAARQAPSAGNYQPWEFIIIRDPEVKSQIVQGCFQNIRRGDVTTGSDGEEDWILEAPVLIVACVNQRLAKGMYGERGEKLYGIQSVAAAIQNLNLAAHAYGLGTCWVGAFSEETIATIIACPKYMRPCAIITLGWPAEKPPKPERHPISDIVHIEKFGRTPREKLVRPRGQLF